MKSEKEIRERKYKLSDDILAYRADMADRRITPTQKLALQNLIDYSEIEIVALEWVLK